MYNTAEEEEVDQHQSPIALSDEQQMKRFLKYEVTIG